MNDTLLKMKFDIKKFLKKRERTCANRERKYKKEIFRQDPYEEKKKKFLKYLILINLNHSFIHSFSFDKY